jgi:hypothetical protein
MRKTTSAAAISCCDMLIHRIDESLCPITAK